jgi:hypothetical protein
MDPTKKGQRLEEHERYDDAVIIARKRPEVIPEDPLADRDCGRSHQIAQKRAKFISGLPRQPPNSLVSESTRAMCQRDRTAPYLVI